MYVVALAPTPHRAAYVALMSTRPTVGSPARGAMKRTVSFPNTDHAEAGYGSVPGTGDDEPSTSSGWTTMPLVAGRLLLTIAVFGVLGSLLPFFAVGWANKLGNAPGFVKKTGGSVSGLQMLQSQKKRRLDILRSLYWSFGRTLLQLEIEDIRMNICTIYYYMETLNLMQIQKIRGY